MRPDIVASRGVSIGHPVDNTEIWILDADLQPCPIGVPGEICIAGDGLALGYIDRPELTAERFVATRILGSATGPLLSWLERAVFPEEARFHDEGHARAVALELTTRLAAFGTTTAVLFSSSSPIATRVLFEVLDASGLRAIAGLVLMDQRSPEALRVDAGEALGACVELADAFHGRDRGRLWFAITPRFAPTCSRALLEGAGFLAQVLVAVPECQAALHKEGSVALLTMDVVLHR